MKTLLYSTLLLLLSLATFAQVMEHPNEENEDDRISNSINAPQCRVTMNQDGVSVAAAEASGRLVTMVTDQNGNTVFSDSIVVNGTALQFLGQGNFWFGRVLLDVVTLSDNRFAVIYTTSDASELPVFLRMRVFRYITTPNTTQLIGDYLLENNLLTYYMYNLRCEANNNSVVIAFSSQFDSTSNFRRYDIPLNSNPILVSSVNLPYYGDGNFVSVDIDKTTNELYILHSSADATTTNNYKKLRILKYSNLNATTLLSSTIVNDYMWGRCIPGISVNKSGQISISYYEHSTPQSSTYPKNFQLRNQVFTTPQNIFTLLDDSYLCSFDIQLFHENVGGFYTSDVAINDRIKQTIFDQTFNNFISYDTFGIINYTNGLYIYTLNIGSTDIARIDMLDTGVNVIEPSTNRTKVTYHDIANSGYGCQLFTGAWLYNNMSNLPPLFQKVLPSSTPTVLINGGTDSVFCYNDTLTATFIYDTLLTVNSFEWVYDATKIRAITPLNNDTVVFVGNTSANTLTVVNLGVRLFFCTTASPVGSINITFLDAPAPVVSLDPPITCPGGGVDVRLINPDCNTWGVTYGLFGPNLFAPDWFFNNCNYDTLIFPSQTGSYYAEIEKNWGTKTCRNKTPFQITIDSLHGVISSTHNELCRGLNTDLLFTFTNPIWNQANLDFLWTFPPKTYRQNSLITSSTTKDVQGVYFDEAGTKTITLQVSQQGCTNTFSIVLEVSPDCCRPQDGAINGVPVATYFGSSTKDLGIPGQTNVLNLNGSVVSLKGNFHLYNTLSVVGPGLLEINDATIFIETNNFDNPNVKTGNILIDDLTSVSINRSRITSMCDAMWSGVFKHEGALLIDQSEISHSMHGLVSVGTQSNVPTNSVNPVIATNNYFYNNLNAAITDIRESYSLFPDNNFIENSFYSDPSTMKAPYNLGGPFNNGDRYALTYIRLHQGNYAATRIRSNTFDNVYCAIELLSGDGIVTRLNTFKNFYRKGILATGVATLTSQADTFYFSASTPIAMPSYEYTASYDPFYGEGIANNDAIQTQLSVGTTITSGDLVIGIASQGKTTVTQNSFFGYTGTAFNRQMGIEIPSGERTYMVNNRFENLQFGVLRQLLGNHTHADTIENNTLEDCMYGLYYTGFYDSTMVNPYNPKLHCNLFRKNTPGLPWAYGLYMENGAGIREIGGNGSFPTFTPPSGNGWDGLDTTNNGYAIWNHPGNVTVSYYRYNNEQVFPSDVFGTNLQTPFIAATPYLNPITQQPNVDPTCFSNPQVFFSKPAGTGSMTHKTSDIIVNELKQNLVYPNPSDGKFNIDLKNEIKENQIISAHVIDNKGVLKEVSKNLKREKNSFRIDLSSLSSGLYTLMIHIDNHLVASEKIVIQ